VDVAHASRANIESRHEPILTQRCTSFYAAVEGPDRHWLVEERPDELARLIKRHTAAR